MVGRERRGGPANGVPASDASGSTEDERSESSGVSGTSVSKAHRKAAAASGAGRIVTSVQPTASLGQPSTALADSERARPPRPSPRPRKHRWHEERSGVLVSGVPASTTSGSTEDEQNGSSGVTEGHRDTQSRVVAGRRAAEGCQRVTLAVPYSVH